MKRVLLIAATVVAGSFQTSALEPQVFEDAYLTSISANGNWIAGATDDGCVVIRNLETNKSWNYNAGASITGAINNYYIGIGKAISNDGVLAGATTADNAAYWENGKWTVLKTPNPEYMSNACSITSDSKVICGGIGMDEFSEMAENIMLVPAVWYRQEDGTYGEAVPLPHPELDFTGRVPQYITAVAISDDGKTVAGQIRDYIGFMHEPIIYQCDDAGNWTYKRLMPDLINPTHMEFPEYPGEFDLLQPSPEWFMTEEELAAYSHAVDTWTSDTPFPEYYSFMTEEEIAEYEESMDLFLQVYLPWAKKFDDFETAYYNCIYEGYSFSFNNVFLSPDGKYYVSTSEVMYIDDPLTPFTIDNPVVIDIENETYEDLYSEDHATSLIATCISSDYTVLASSVNPLDPYMPRRAYIYPAGDKEWMPLETFVYERDEAIGDWMEENMLREVITGIDQLGNFIYEDFMCSGVPVVTPDLSIALCATTTDYWADPDDYYYFGFLFPTGVPSGVKSIVANGEYEMNVQHDGSVEFKGEFKTMQVVNIAGSTVYQTQNPAGTVSTGLDSGIYIFRAVTAEGTEIVRKIAI